MIGALGSTVSLSMQTSSLYFQNSVINEYVQGLGQRNLMWLKLRSFPKYSHSFINRASSELHLNRAELNGLQNGYLGFLIFSILTPKTQKFDLKNAFKIQYFEDIQKTRMNVINIGTYTQHAYKISKQCLYSWLCNDPKKNRQGR